MLGLALATPAAFAEEFDPDLADAKLALGRMAGLFADTLAVQGGYVWAYAADGSARRGEGVVEEGENWNQPPGTPAVGAAFLRLNEITSDARWRQAASQAARAVISGQLLSGGWYSFTATEPDARRLWCYRTEGLDGDGCKAIDGNENKNRTSLDDNITSSAVGFLLWWDEATGGADPDAREAAEYALNRLIRAQYPNGGWPVYFNRVDDHDAFAAAWRAEAPEGWPREWTKPSGWPIFIVTDHLVRDQVRLFLAAERRLGKPELLAAAMRSGDFLLAAQLPAPQRGWAQTYDADLKPIWGRRFEPPAVASLETAGSIQALLELHERTGKERYLEGAREAATWLRSVQRPSGDWARFYELGTDRPLFVRQDETLGYDEEDLLEGYGQTGTFGIEEVLALVDRVAAGEQVVVSPGWDWVFEPSRDSDRQATLRLVAAAADSDGRVVEDGWILSATFVDAVRALGELEDQR
jgi:hypothetical protein